MILWIIAALICAIILHEVAGHYLSGYRTVTANVGFFITSAMIWVTSTDWSAVIKDPQDIFIIISAQSFLTIYQQVRSERAKT